MLLEQHCTFFATPKKNQRLDYQVIYYVVSRVVNIIDVGLTFIFILIWNDKHKPPGPQQLHSNGASSVSVALTEPGLVF
jgi:hypothetical protein